MAGKLQKYILLNNRVGKRVENCSDIPTQLLRGKILKALSGPEKPENPENIALTVISSSENINLECPTLDVSKITDTEADLLLAISSVEERFRTYRERNRLTDGQSLDVGSRVFVKVKNLTKDILGVIWYKGHLPTYNGTMFGVELLGKESEGQGTTDGTFKNKRYFECPQDQGVFVALDKLHSMQDQDKKSPKKETAIFSSLKDMMPPFPSKDTSESVVRNMAKEHKLKMDQRVVVFQGKVEPLRGTVRCISERTDRNGDVCVGIELDKRMGHGTGMFRGKQLFVCKKDFALFASVTSIIPEEEYDTYEPGNINFHHPAADRLTQSYGLAGASLGYHEANSGSKRPGSTYFQTCSKNSMPEDEIYSNIPHSGSGTRETKNIHAMYSSAFSASSTDRNRIVPPQSYVEGAVTISSGLEQHKFTDVKQNDFEMRDQQLGPDVGEEDGSKQIDLGLEVGSMVEVPIMEGKGTLYGVIRWIGQLPELPGKIVAGLELETEQVACSDGMFGGKRYFTCPAGRAFFVNLQHCRKDSRFQVECPGAAKYSGRGRSSVPDDKYNNIPHSGSGTQEAKNTDAMYSSVFSASSTDRNWIPPRCFVEGAVSISSGLEQHKFTDVKQNDFEMRDQQLGPDVGKEDGSKQIDLGLEVGSMVEVPIMEGKGTLYGVIRWIGQLPELPGKIVAGLELETERVACSDGRFGAKRYFTCPAGRAFFVNLQYCRKVSRFQAQSPGAAKYSGRDSSKDSNAEMKKLRDEVNIREKAARIQVREQQLNQERQQREGLEQELENTRTANQELEQNLEASKQQRNELQATLSTAQQALEEKRQQRERLEQELENTRTSNQELEQNLEASEQQRNELQATLSMAQQALEEYHSSSGSSDWVLYRDEIVVSDNVIGEGGWGNVMEGTFRGCKVAVKQIHELILSPHNRRLFEREMSIASRCRHPCLLQFIGATNDDQSPLFVTELLDTSLRAVLHERALESTEITTLALDVAKGLNYLHLSHPSPIIHRDISSANVLLWKHGTHWRGKVSDYGTANFMRYSMTVSPGAVVYSAPETQTSRQSPKVDAYSFGVLLCEMNNREFPDPSHRNEQVVMVTNPLFRDLVRRCLVHDPEKRPDMTQIINLLKNRK